MRAVGFPEFLIVLTLVVLYVFPLCRIARKMGYPAAAGALACLPGINVLAFYFLAFAEWPAQRNRQPGSPSPENSFFPGIKYLRAFQSPPLTPLHGRLKEKEAPYSQKEARGLFPFSATRKATNMSLTREQRTEIARQNGAKSKGPKTEAGKAVSRANGLKHGRRAQRLLKEFAANAIAECENIPQFHRMLNDVVKQFTPSSYLELSLASQIAADDWRMHRWNNIESTLLDSEFHRLKRIAERTQSGASPDEIFAEAAETLSGNPNLIRYLDAERRRLIRSRDHAIRLLGRLQTARANQSNTYERTKPTGRIFDLPGTVAA